MAMSPTYIKLETHYQPGFIVLSYVVSLVGAWTTLELLLKRTGGSGLYNVLLLIGAGVAFGSTATFGMHFVGNQAVTLHLPPPFTGRGIPLSYNVGFTILSLVVACLSMILAFSFIGLRLDPKSAEDEADERAPGLSNEKGANEPDFQFAQSGAEDETKVEMDKHDQPRKGTPNHHLNKHTLATFAHRKAQPNKAREDSVDGGDFGTQPAKVSRAGIAKILGAGFICGGGIAAMHYVGQVSINSVPRVTNTAWIVAISILIAMLAVSLGLFLLFVVLRPKLEHRWYKRLGVAMILGVGVCLMHFVALLGTHYYIIEGERLVVPSSSARSRHLIIALVCVVAPVCCLSLLVFAFVGQQRALRQIAARHRIVLAVAIFDHQGLLLCKPDDGLLPSSQIFPNSGPEDDRTSIWQLFGLRNRLSLEASSRKLTRADPAFIAFLRASWSWRGHKEKSTAVTTSGQTTEQPDGMASATSHHDTTGSVANSSRVSIADIIADSRRDSESDHEGAMSGPAIEAMRRSVLGFELAARDIATALSGNSNLQSTGVLFDEILKTGHFQVSSKTSGDSFTVTQGQLLLLTRRLRSTSERNALISRGYVFAEPQAVARMTSNAFAVPIDRVFDFFRDAYRFSKFGIARRYDRGRLYGGVLIVQALAGEGLQIIADEMYHHALPMIEMATLVQRTSDRQTLPPSSLATSTLKGLVQGLESLGGHSLEEILSSADPYPNFHSAQVQGFLSSILFPYLSRALPPETLAYLRPRLIVSPQVIPLSRRDGPLFGADGVTQDSYLICLKAIVPSAVTLPSSSTVNWLPFSLFKAQADCITRATGPPRPRHQSPSNNVPTGHVSGLDTRQNTLANVFPARDTSSTSSSRHYAAVGGEGRQGSIVEEDGPDTIRNETDDPARPPGVPQYDSDFVFKLVRTTIQPGRPWTWELPEHERGAHRPRQEM